MKWTFHLNFDDCSRDVKKPAQKLIFSGSFLIITSLCSAVSACQKRLVCDSCVFRVLDFVSEYRLINKVGDDLVSNVDRYAANGISPATGSATARRVTWSGAEPVEGGHRNVAASRPGAGTGSRAAHRRCWSSQVDQFSDGDKQWRTRNQAVEEDKFVSAFLSYWNGLLFPLFSPPASDSRINVSSAIPRNWEENLGQPSTKWYADCVTSGKSVKGFFELEGTYPKKFHCISGMPQRQKWVLLRFPTL